MTVTHTVTAPLVIASDAEGRQVYLYRGAPVPAQIPAKEVTRLVEGGFVVADAPPAEADAQPEGAPDESWKVAQLKAHAAASGIDLGDATVKADILAAIVAAKD